MTIIIIITNYFDVASIVSFPPPLPYLASHSFPFLHFLLSRSSLASLSSISFPPHPFLHSLTSPPIPFLSSLPLPLPPLPPFLFPSFPHLLPSLHNSSTLPSSEAIRHLLWKRSKRSSTHSLNYFNRLCVHTLCTDSFVSLTGSVIFTHVHRVIGLYQWMSIYLILLFLIFFFFYSILFRHVLLRPEVLLKHFTYVSLPLSLSLLLSPSLSFSLSLSFYLSLFLSLSLSFSLSVSLTHSLCLCLSHPSIISIKIDLTL